MARYNVSCLCGECGRFHQSKSSVGVTDGPNRVKRIDAVYRPNTLPSEVPKLLRSYVMCSVTRASLKQRTVVAHMKRGESPAELLPAQAAVVRIVDQIPVIVQFNEVVPQGREKN